MGNDLISRKKLLTEYDRVHVGEPGGARMLIAEAKSVDAVVVVRCENCARRQGKRCPHRVCDLCMDGYCEQGVPADG